jgi:phosphoribosylformylglycinamidine synthase subunit PurL
VKHLKNLLKSFNIECTKIGQVGGDKISINDIYKDLDKVSYVYFNRFKQVIEQDL